MMLCVVYSTVTSLPWSLYGTFVVEERHGFNKQVKQVLFIYFVLLFIFYYALRYHFSLVVVTNNRQQFSKNAFII